MTQVIKTERLVLRPPVDADGAVVIAGLNDFEVVKWLARPPYPFTSADLRLRNEDGSSRWPDLAAIEYEGEMIGLVSGIPHLGFWLLRRAWGQGFATETARGMIELCFRDPECLELNSGYFEGNAASAQVLAKLGFIETGRGAELCRARSEELPHVNLSLTRQRWEQGA